MFVASSVADKTGRGVVVDDPGQIATKLETEGLRYLLYTEFHGHP